MDEALRILIVDDNPRDRAMVIRELCKEYPDAVVREARDQAELDQALDADAFDLVVTDYQLGWSNGIQVLHAVKARYPHCPVIMFTATGSQEIAVEAMKSGLDDYIIKTAEHIMRLRSAVKAAIKHTETDRQVEQLQARLASLLTRLRVGVFRCSRDGRLVEVNDAFLHIFELPSPEAATGREFRGLLAKPKEYDRHLCRLLEDEQPQELELQSQDPNGDATWLQISQSVHRPAQGEATVAGLVEDITERKRAEEALRESEEKHRILFESSRDAIMTLAPPSWDFTSGNPACVAMFGARDEAEFTSFPPWALSSEHQPDGRPSADKAQEMIDTAMREGSHFFEWTHRRLDATEFPADVLLTRMEIGGQTLLQATVRDLTQQKQMEEQLRHTQKMEAVGQLAAGVAHEFNNLLFGILGSAELILATREGELPEYLERPLRDIKKCGRRGAVLTKQLLSFARKKKPVVSQFDINQVVGELEGILRKMVGETVTLETDFASDLPPVEADRGEIEQAVINLARNAHDAMPAGGSLTIRTTTQQLDQARVSTYPHARSGTYVQLSVADTGCGMSPETTKRIFEPFFTTKPVGKGTGLGLSTVFADVTKSGGIIEVESHEGKGTVFHIYLPAAEERADADSDDAEHSADLFPGGSETILVVDDDEVVLDSGAYILEMRGYNVIRALGAPQALEAAASHDGTIDLLLTDVTMPEMNGWELAQKLAEQRPDMKVIFMSGYAADVLKAGAAEGEHIEFLEKPPEGDMLFRRIREVLGGQGESP